MTPPAVTVNDAITAGMAAYMDKKFGPFKD
jgi:hypothetical protein